MTEKGFFTSSVVQKAGIIQLRSIMKKLVQSSPYTHFLQIHMVELYVFSMRRNWKWLY